ncbi:MAG: anti-sigma factor [Verrucomicrobia bacterium]|nr:anti-sigma factor [Verrucomicrobiota bacterium]
MIDEHHEELASLYALDLLEGAELAQFEAAHAKDPALQKLVRELRESSAALAHLTQAPPPPASLKARVLALVDAHGAAATPGNVIRRPASPEPGAGSFALRHFIPWAAAAGLALAAGWVAQLYYISRSEIALLTNQQALAELALQSARNQLEAERLLAQRQLSDLTQQLKAQGDLANFKITTLASMLNNSPQALAVAVWDPARQEGILQVEKLPALATDRDYQLWVVDPQYPSPVDGGVFTVDARTGAARIPFKSKQPVKTIDAFAVTLERKGGVPKAEGPFVLLGK